MEIFLVICVLIITLNQSLEIFLKFSLVVRWLNRATERRMLKRMQSSPPPRLPTVQPYNPRRGKFRGQESSE